VATTLVVSLVVDCGVSERTAEAQHFVKKAMRGGKRTTKNLFSMEVIKLKSL